MLLPAPGGCHEKQFTIYYTAIAHNKPECFMKNTTDYLKSSYYQNDMLDYEQMTEDTVCTIFTLGARLPSG